MREVRLCCNLFSEVLSLNISWELLEESIIVTLGLVSLLRKSIPVYGVFFTPVKAF